MKGYILITTLLFVLLLSMLVASAYESVSSEQQLLYLIGVKNGS